MTKKIANKDINLVLFDLDGTLANTAPDLIESVLKTFIEYDLPAPDPALIHEQISRGGRAMLLADIKSPLPDHTIDQMLDRFLELYRDNIATHTTLFPGMEMLISHLEFNQIRWGIVTNKRACLAEPLIDALQLRQRIACLVSGDSAARSKPHPDPLLLALEQTASKAAESVYVGDAEVDVLASRAAQLAVVIAQYGYIASHESPAAWGADGYIDTPLDLLDWFDRQHNSID